MSIHLKYIAPLFGDAVREYAPKINTGVAFSIPQEQNFGDFSTNIAMILGNTLKKNPREVAQSLIDIVTKSPDFWAVKKLEIAGPGFINIWLSDEEFSRIFKELNTQIEQKTFAQQSQKKKKVVTDTSHPNVAKPMGVHHLLSTVIGQAINNLLKRCGYDVWRDNYIGDWGTQFGKLTYAIKTWGDLNHILKDPISELLKLYVKFHEEAEKDPQLEVRGREEFKKLEDGNEENRKLWLWVCDVSLVEFYKIWNRLGVDFDVINGESFYEDKMQKIIDGGIKKKVIIKGEGGSLIIPMDDSNLPPCIVKKSDGATTYATRDLARMEYWQNELKADIGINVVDVAQKLHFDQIFESAKKLGINKMQHVHVDFGRMEFPDGGMSTRKGKVVLLEDVLDEAERRAAEKIKSHESDLSPQDKQKLARIMGIGAIKYNVLSQSRQKNYTFIWDQMLSFEGNSAPYLQYAYARTRSIKRKVEQLEIKFDNNNTFSISHEKEKELLKKIIAFEDAIVISAEFYRPNILCTYLFELAQVFSNFYNELSVLNSDLLESRINRIRLVENTAYVLKTGLEILGIEVPERM